LPPAPGWRDIIDKLCADIMALDPGPKFKAEQIKEKFGGLRFYVSGYPDDPDKAAAIGKLIGDAEMLSYKTCEMCGTNNDVTLNSNGWIQSLCGVCRVQRKVLEEDMVKEYMASREKMNAKRVEWLKKRSKSDVGA
jgi:hypothetical protein